MGRLSAVSEIRLWVSKKEKKDRDNQRKHKGLPLNLYNLTLFVT